MYKTVSQIISAAKILIRRPSTQRLADEDLRLLLHQALEQMHSVAIQENGDFYTHERGITLSYDQTAMAYSYEVDSLDQARYEVYPIRMRYQDLSADADTDDWYQARKVPFTSFQDQSNQKRVVWSTTGNNFDALGGKYLRINANPEYVGEQRWRLAFRAFPLEVLTYQDEVPFPAEFSSLLEYAVALGALPLVRDNSPEWQQFVQLQFPSLRGQLQLRQMEFKQWLNRDIEMTIVTERPYHYLNNNVLRSGIRSRIRMDD